MLAVPRDRISQALSLPRGMSNAAARRMIDACCPAFQMVTSGIQSIPKALNQLSVSTDLRGVS